MPHLSIQAHEGLVAEEEHEEDEGEEEGNRGEFDDEEEDLLVDDVFVDGQEDSRGEVKLWLNKTKQHFTNMADIPEDFTNMGTIPEETIVEWSEHKESEKFVRTSSACELPVLSGVDYQEEESVWMEDSTIVNNIRLNQMIHMDAGAKIEKISQSLDMIENDFKISTSSQFLVTSLRGLTKELQGILTERTRKINHLEAQCEKQQSLMNSHRNENEYVLEKIDHAMKELENTITEQYKKIDQLDKNSAAQQMLVDNYKKERLQNLSKIENLEQSLMMANGERKKAMEKVSALEGREVSYKANKEALMERILHLQIGVERQKADKELLLERIVNLEVELDEMVREDTDEKDVLVERVEELEAILNNNNNENDINNNNSINNNKPCMLSHDTKHEVHVISKELLKQEKKRGVGVDVVDQGKYASKGVAINVIHNMLHKDKLAKLI